MILALFILLFFQFLGEGLVRYFNLFIPGPVMGMVFFFGALVFFPVLKSRTESLGIFISQHLSLFFIPAGVGMIEYFDLFGQHGAAIVITIIISTTITIVATALIFNTLLKVKGHKGEAHD
ncbi:CidA/LrgA family protein [Bdellovibrio sp. SKB1291214]|uniref:CidA/LrgA family protein n=1 Tax=Bdellovibrio sp. SKB1291214 TaxID=1732569 RepID=UPI000B5171ED|nr:CidA/LrgA family protein [Bdellovibrio sp. SKB1291214]UYL08695.1 CidA/LrgA family protein [Bdellovibrio sp. SKB1291214]